MTQIRNIIGFDTPSKAKAQKDLSKGAKKEKPVELNINKLKQETINRVSSLANLIVSNDFVKYEPIQRQQILMDFTYYSKVADIL